MSWPLPGSSGCGCPTGSAVCTCGTPAWIPIPDDELAGPPPLYPDGDSCYVVPKRPADFKLPDGSVLHVSDQGEWFIDDKDAKVIYGPCKYREFNPFVNASDLLARFIKYVGSLGVRRSEVATLPLNLFVNWLILEAATRDGDPAPVDVTPVPRHELLRERIQPRCPVCQRYLRRESPFRYCDPECAAKHYQQLPSSAVERRRARSRDLTEGGLKQ